MLLRAANHFYVVYNFVCRKDEEKLNANVSGNLTYVYYYDYEKYYYEADVTQDKQNTFKLTDKVYIPNIPLLSVLAQLNDVNLPAIFRKFLEGTYYFIAGSYQECFLRTFSKRQSIMFIVIVTFHLLMCVSRKSKLEKHIQLISK